MLESVLIRRTYIIHADAKVESGSIGQIVPEKWSFHSIVTFINVELCLFWFGFYWYEKVQLNFLPGTILPNPVIRFIGTYLNHTNIDGRVTLNLTFYVSIMCSQAKQIAFCWLLIRFIEVPFSCFLSNYL